MGNDDFYFFARFSLDVVEMPALTLLTALVWGFISFQQQMLLSPQSHTLFGYATLSSTFWVRVGEKNLSNEKISGN